MDELAHRRYADWDAAYVLGALSADERRDYERHVEGCERCRGAIGELAPLPGMLARIDAAEAVAILDEGGTPLPLPVADRRRRRRIPWVAVAAAALVLAALLVPSLGNHHGSTPSATVTLSQTVPSPLTATVALTKASWGTRIDMTCTYAAIYRGADAAYELYVVDRSGHAAKVSSWRAGPGEVVHTSGSSDLALADISALQVRDAQGEVLLSAAMKG